MKKLKIGLIAIALLIGGVQAYGGLKFTTYYCVAGTVPGSNHYTVSATSPAFSCSGGTLFLYVCTFSTSGSYTPGQQIAASACTVLSTYED